MITQLQRTRENWTYGIINIPLLYGHNNRKGVNPKTIIRKFAHNAKCYRKPFPALDKSKRYLWYENDTTDINFHNQVLAYYRDWHIDVCWHRTMKGYHYITLKLWTLKQYNLEVDYMKERFNNGTFYYSLRIIPNKWINEANPLCWYVGNIENNGSGHMKQLQYVWDALMKPYYFNYNRTIPRTVELLENVFCISRYEFKGALQV